MIPFRLILITDWALPDCVERVAAACSVAPSRLAVQHRHPGASDATFLKEGERLKLALGDTPLFVNGRLDVALALHAHLHLPSWALEPRDVRPLLPGRWLSASWHPPEAPRDVDLLLASPVFAPTSKPVDRPPLGIAGFKALRAPPPVFALGGITAQRAQALRPLAGAAVIGEVLHAADPARATQRLLEALS